MTKVFRNLFPIAAFAVAINYGWECYDNYNVNMDIANKCADLVATWLLITVYAICDMEIGDEADNDVNPDKD